MVKINKRMLIFFLANFIVSDLRSEPEWLRTIKRFEVETGALTLSASQAAPIVKEAQEILNAIEHEDITALLDRISPTDFKVFSIELVNLTPLDIRDKFTTSLRNKAGEEYGYYFNVDEYLKCNKDMKDSPEEYRKLLGGMDFRHYLLKYRGKISFRVTRTKKEVHGIPSNVYIVSYSFPDNLMYIHGHRRIYLSGKTGKLKWIGY